MDHDCKHEVEIYRIIKQLDGNGQPGLMQTVTEISTRMESLTEVITNLSVKIEEFMTFKAEQSGVEKHKGKSLNKTQVLVSAIIGGSMIITSIILKFL